MAKKHAPSQSDAAPDPSDAYERSHPEHEAGMGKLKNTAKPPPHKGPDHISDAVTQAQDGTRQINAQENPHAEKPATVNSPLGWDTKQKRK